MQTITYKQASELLEVEYGTIKQAVSRGMLTKFASKSQQALLIREQVELFKGKNRISKQSLNLEENAKWEEYREMADKSLEIPSNGTENQESIISILRTNNVFIERNLSKMERINTIMDSCITEYKELFNEIKEIMPKELEESFPHLPLILKNA